MIKILRYSIRFSVISLSILLLIGCASKKTPGSIDNSCVTWQQRIDSAMPDSGQNLWQLPSTDAKTIEAIDCLFKLEGRKGTATFGGAMRNDVSAIIPETPLEVGAIYYILYLYTGSPDHASAVALLDSTGELNRPESIALAWKYYKEWWQKVKQVGLKRARQMKLMPLTDKEVWWYK